MKVRENRTLLAVFDWESRGLREDPVFLEWRRQPSHPSVIRLDPAMQQAITRSPYLRQLIRLSSR